jgi:hypothetical protein
MASNSGTGVFGGSYFLGFLAAVVYYIQSATSFWDGLVGFFQAIIWPAFLIYGLHTFLRL